MNNIVYDHYDQYEDLYLYYKKNKAKFAKHPKIIAFFEEIEKNKTQLNKLGVIKGEKSNLVPEQLNILKKEMGLAIHANSYPVYIYFKEKGDVEMQNHLKHDKITLTRISYVKALDIYEKILNFCTPRLKEFKSVGVTADSLKEMTTARDKYVAFREHKDYSPKWKMVMTKKVHDLDKDTIRIIKNNLTIAMEPFKNSDNILYKDYLNIINRCKMSVIY